MWTPPLDRRGAGDKPPRPPGSSFTLSRRTTHPLGVEGRHGCAGRPERRGAWGARSGPPMSDRSRRPGMTQTMKAWFTVPGPEGAVFELRETPVPSPGPGQILVAVRAAGVNRGELIRGAQVRSA